VSFFLRHGRENGKFEGLEACVALRRLLPYEQFVELIQNGCDTLQGLLASFDYSFLIQQALSKQKNPDDDVISTAGNR